MGFKTSFSRKTSNPLPENKATMAFEQQEAALAEGTQAFHIQAGGIVNASTYETVFTITKSTAPGSATGRPMLDLFRPGEDRPFATIRFKTMSSSMEVIVNNRSTTLHENGFAGFRYYFAPIGNPKARWCWDEKNYGATALLDTRQNEKRIASFKGDMLQFGIDVDPALVTDILVSAFAIYWKKSGLDIGKSKFGERVEVWKSILA